MTGAIPQPLSTNGLEFAAGNPLGKFCFAPDLSIIDQLIVRFYGDVASSSICAATDFSTVGRGRAASRLKHANNNGVNRRSVESRALFTEGCIVPATASVWKRSFPFERCPRGISDRSANVSVSTRIEGV